MGAAEIIALVMAIIQAAPTIEAGIEKAKSLIDAMFTAKIISASVQDALHDTVDAYGRLAALGPPLWWQVEPDPV
jgi:hypothetical protein